MGPSVPSVSSFRPTAPISGSYVSPCRSPHPSYPNLSEPQERSLATLTLQLGHCGFSGFHPLESMCEACFFNRNESSSLVRFDLMRLPTPLIDVARFETASGADFFPFNPTRCTNFDSSEYHVACIFLRDWRRLDHHGYRVPIDRQRGSGRGDYG